MKRITLLVTFTAGLIAGACLSISPTRAALEQEKSDRAARKKLLRHVVLFKFKKSATKKDIQRVVAAFGALKNKIDTIVGFEMGTDVSVENKSKGFTHGFVVTFRDEKGRKTYLPHPAHKAFVKIVGPVLEDVLVFDYWTTP